jgi:hypothetical protein
VCALASIAECSAAAMSIWRKAAHGSSPVFSGRAPPAIAACRHYFMSHAAVQRGVHPFTPPLSHRPISKTVRFNMLKIIRAAAGGDKKSFTGM